MLTDIDQHEQKGFRACRFAIADRWGMYREFDEDGAFLIARVCHHLGTKGGCPRYLAFEGCGCACPYMHARSRALGRWLIAGARNVDNKRPTPWDAAIAHKDAKGSCLLQGLPYIDGFCVGPREWREVHNPSHQVPGPNTQDPLERIDAFDPLTVSAVERVRREVQASFADMQAYW